MSARAPRASARTRAREDKGSRAGARAPTAQRGHSSCVRSVCVQQRGDGDGFGGGGGGEGEGAGLPRAKPGGRYGDGANPAGFLLISAGAGAAPGAAARAPRGEVRPEVVQLTRVAVEPSSSWPVAATAAARPAARRRRHLVGEQAHEPQPARLGEEGEALPHLGLRARPTGGGMCSSPNCRGSTCAARERKTERSRAAAVQPRARRRASRGEDRNTPRRGGAAAARGRGRAPRRRSRPRRSRCA